MLNSDYDFLDTAIESGFYEKPVDAPKTQEQIISDLAELSSFDYDKVRKEKAKEFGIKVSTLDEAIKSRRQVSSESLPIDRDGELRQSTLSIEIARILNDTACYDIITKQWHYRYGNIFKSGHDENIQVLVMRELDRIKPDGYAISWVTSISAFLKLRMKIDEFETDRHLLPMVNGVLNLQTKTLEKYDDHNFFSWQLPYEYNPAAICPIVEDYLKMVTAGDEQKIAFLKAWLYVVLFGRCDLQVYVEANGSGGTGKSTYQQLCTLLVGDENTMVTDLSRLEKNPYETANLKGKRLLLVTDSGKYAGEVNKLKAITGEDTVPYERKNIQQSDGFKYKGLVMVASNEPIQSSDYTSGLSRRKIPVEFNVRATEEDKNRYRKQGGIIEAMKPEMSGLVNLLLAMNENDVISIIKNPAGSMLREKIETEISTNPILGWIDENLIRCDKGNEVNFVGNASNDPEHFFYANYVTWCKDQGRFPVKVDGFSRLVIDNCGTYGITTQKLGKQRRVGAPPDVSQGTVLDGLRLRVKNTDDYIEGLITKNISCDNLVTTSVTTQTPSSDKCDKCDNLPSSVTFAEKMEVLL
jgi:putative DNA primase/helicase